jgi:hypothetical protein
VDAAIIPLSRVKDLQQSSDKPRALAIFGVNQWNTRKTFDRIPSIEAELDAKPPDNDWVILLSPSGIGRRNHDELSSLIQSASLDAEFLRTLQQLGLERMIWGGQDFQTAHSHRLQLLASRLLVEILAAPPELAPAGTDPRITTVDPKAELKAPPSRKRPDLGALINPVQKKPDVGGGGLPPDKTAQLVLPAPERAPKEEKPPPKKEHVTSPYPEQVVDRSPAVVDGKADPKTIVKPPFRATPLGQPLSPDKPRTENLNAPRTPNSPLGGYAGYTRFQGNKKHGGFDDHGGSEQRQSSAKEQQWRDRALTRYEGTGPGKVVYAGEMHEKKNKDGTGGLSVGFGVTIVYNDAQGNSWRSTTMHHKEVA